MSDDEDFFVEEATASAPPKIRKLNSFKKLVRQLASEGWYDARVEERPHVTARSPRANTSPIRPEHRGSFRIEIVALADSEAITTRDWDPDDTRRRERIQQRKEKGPALAVYAVQIPSDVDFAGRWLAAPDGQLVTAIGFDEYLLDHSYITIEADGIRRPQLGARTLGGARDARVLPCGLIVVDGFETVGTRKAAPKKTSCCSSGEGGFAHRNCEAARRLSFNGSTPTSRLRDMATITSSCTRITDVESVTRWIPWAVERYYGSCDFPPLSGRQEMAAKIKAHFGSFGRPR